MPENIYYILTSLAIAAVIIPLIRKDHWTFRAFEFPRLQKFVYVLLVFIYGWVVFGQETHFYILQGLLAVVVIHLGYLIYPYTPLAKKMMKSAVNHGKQPDLRLMIYNVYQKNSKYEKLLRLVGKYKPDMVMLVETDENWLKETEVLKGEFPHYILHPQDDTYGMLLYSKFPIEKYEIRFLIKEKVPSIKAVVNLADEKQFMFFGVHPEPPAPDENAYSTARDHELMKIAEESRNLDCPIIVAGDLNDVAWSFTTDSFLETSKLLDPRKGRGVFATFHTKSFLMRWPLDHIFCSKHFSLVRINRLEHIGSDHFPVLVELMLTEDYKFSGNDF